MCHSRNLVHKITSRYLSLSLAFGILSIATIVCLQDEDEDEGVPQPESGAQDHKQVFELESCFWHYIHCDHCVFAGRGRGRGCATA